eukprot:4837114-Pyramimonas_sp.AAC.1
MTTREHCLFSFCANESGATDGLEACGVGFLCLLSIGNGVVSPRIGEFYSFLLADPLCPATPMCLLQVLPALRLPVPIPDLDQVDIAPAAVPQVSCLPSMLIAIRY